MWITIISGGQSLKSCWQAHPPHSIRCGLTCISVKLTSNTCNRYTLQRVHFVTCAMCTLQHMHLAVACYDMLRASWTDQFSKFEALASSHIWRLTFQIVQLPSLTKFFSWLCLIGLWAGQHWYVIFFKSLFWYHIVHNHNTSLAAPGALAHRLQNPKWPPVGPKMADGVWKGVCP